MNQKEPRESESLREALAAAAQACERAKRERNALIREARERGASLRDIAPIFGVAPTTVMRWAPLDSDVSGDVLDAPL